MTHGYKYETLLMAGKKEAIGKKDQKWMDQTFRDININVNGFYVFNQLSYYALELAGFIAWNGHRKRNCTTFINIGMEKTLKDFVPIEEGVNDPAIFKAVFLAGGPGSGKSFIVGKTAPAFGYKVVNSDNAFEMALKKAGMEMTADNIFSVKGQSLRDRATNLTKQRKQSYINGRLGLVLTELVRTTKKSRSRKSN